MVLAVVLKMTSYRLIIGTSCAFSINSIWCSDGGDSGKRCIIVIWRGRAGHLPSFSANGKLYDEPRALITDQSLCCNHGLPIHAIGTALVSTEPTPTLPCTMRHLDVDLCKSLNSVF
jgi:hypothetical protein